MTATARGRLVALGCASLAVLALLGACTEQAPPAPPAVAPSPPPRAGEATATATPSAGYLRQAQYYYQLGQQELQIGALHAAVLAFETALDLAPGNAGYRRALDEARAAAAQAGDRGTSAVFLVSTPAPLPTDTPAPSPTAPAPPSPTPRPRGCGGDEQLAFDPPSAALGDRVTISVTAAREHENVRLDGPGVEFLGVRARPGGFLWQWASANLPKGNLSYAFFVDGGTRCAQASLTVTGRWEAVGAGLPAAADFRVSALAASPNFPADKTLLVAFDGLGVFRSVDADAPSPTFGPVNAGLTNLGITALAMSPNFARDRTALAGTRDGAVFRSINGADSWTALPVPFTGLGSVTALAFSPTVASDGTVFAGVDGAGVFRSERRGDGWTAVNEGLTDTNVQALAVPAAYGSDGAMFAGGRFGGVHRLAGTPTPRWSAVNTGLESLSIEALGVAPYHGNASTVLAGAKFGGLYKFDGARWQQVNKGLSDRWAWVRSIALSPYFASDGFAYAGTRSGVFRTGDGATTWAAMNAGLPAAAVADLDAGVRALAVSPDFANDRWVFAGLWLGGLFRAGD